jgi:hypothetical protein
LDASIASLILRQNGQDQAAGTKRSQHCQPTSPPARLHPFVRRDTLKELTEFIIGESGITDDIAHRDCIHRIVSRDSQDARSVGHDDVFALTCDPKASLFERPNCVKVIDTR